MVRQQSGIVLLSTYLDILSRGPIILQHTAHNTSPRTASPHRQHTPSLVSSVQFHLSQHQKNWFQVISLLGKLSIFVKSREQNSKFLKVRQVGKIDWFNLIVQTSESSRRNGRSVAVEIFYFDLSRCVSCHFPANKLAMFDNVRTG